MAEGMAGLMAVPHLDLDPSLMGGWDAAVLAGGLGDGPVDQGFASVVWRATRPGWTQAGWWDADLRPVVRELLWLPLGLDLQQRLVALAAADRAAGYPRGDCPHAHAAPSAEEQAGVPGHPCACQVVMVAAWTAVASWVALQADQEVVAVAGKDPVEELLVPDRPELGTLTDPAVEELAPALRVSPGSARNRLALLRRLSAQPRLRDAVASGLIIGWHAHLLATDLRLLPAKDQRTVIGQVLDRHRSRRNKGLREWTLSDLRAHAKRIAARLDLDLATRRQACHDQRGIRLRLHGHGAATISADLADDVATRIFNRLTAIAHGLPAESDGDDGPRSLEQRRADVFTDLLLGTPGTGESVEGGESVGDAHPAPATLAGSEIAVVIDLATLLRLGENPADMPGCGPIPAEIARQLAADTRWRAWITTTTAAGTQVVATSPGTYRPTAALARLIRAREPHCRMPGCRSQITDLDHVIPFPTGQTTQENLGPLCRRHHRMKTHTRWRQHAHADGGPRRDSARSDPVIGESGDSSGRGAHGWTWTTPAGITHTDDPDPPLA